MSTGNARGSLIAGILLISLGGIFLMESSLGFFWLWNLLSTWWPLILIALGLRQILRYFRFSTR